MRLVETLQKNVLETSTGFIVSKLRFRKRRNVLFPEDILAKYIKKLERKNEDVSFRIGYEWGRIVTENICPKPFKRFLSLASKTAKEIWIGYGLLDDFKMYKEGDKYFTETKNEFITRIIGKNKFMFGCRVGATESFFKKKVANADMKMHNDIAIYSFELVDEKPEEIKSKKSSEYYTLNRELFIQKESLKKFVKFKIFKIDKNKIFIGKKILLNIENTVFHILKRNLLKQELIKISSNFLDEVAPKIRGQALLKILKTYLNISGWGITTIVSDSRNVKIYLRNPPFGFQREDDNWDFLAYTLNGFLKRNNFSLEKISFLKGKNTVSMKFSF